MAYEDMERVKNELLNDPNYEQVFFSHFGVVLAKLPVPDR